VKRVLLSRFGSIGTQHPHLMQTTTRRKGRREIKPTWPQVHLRRTSMHWLYPGRVYSVNVTGGAAPHAYHYYPLPQMFLNRPGASAA
jgi:hypothetical protein